MSLLGMPPRIPVPRQVYRMHPDLYDSSDAAAHPVLVVTVDKVLRIAEVVTRTSTWEARGPGGVAHPPQPDLGLDRTGWWRVQWPKSVAFSAFMDPEAQLRGLLEERTWAHVQAALFGRGGGP